jgi:hypothetical protein
MSVCLYTLSFITITILQIAYRPFFYLKQDDSQTRFSLHLHVDFTQLSPTDREHGDRTQSPKRRVLNKRDDDR